MSNECLNCADCRQYCQVLDGLVGETATTPCEWPKQLESGYDFSASSDPALAQRAASRLLRGLTVGNKIQELIDTPKTELNVAYTTRRAIFGAQMNLWQSYARAAQEGRVITDVEVEYYTDQLTDELKTVDLHIRQAGVSAEKLTYAQAIHDRETLEEHGLLFDENMLQVVTQLCANAAAGQSSLPIGDKGIAKTQAAKFVSKLFAPDDKPRFISGDGSMMKDEFIGKMTLQEENGATVTSFKRGMLTECMEQGIPLVLDEINLIDPAIVMRLQDILLRKPGDVITLQEDGGEAITIKHGFCVIATANEASSRYHSRAALDPAFRDRFNVIPLEYPDGNTVMLQTKNRPASLARLAYAFAISSSGVASSRVTFPDALWLASVSHASQQLYSKPAKDVQTGLLGTKVANVVDDTEPRMNDCITPRKMTGILRSIHQGLNPYDVAAGVRGLTMDTIAAMQSSEDRQTMFEVIRLMYDGPADEFDETAIRKRLRI